MSPDSRPVDVFFAIPCGEFFSVQNRVIKSVCRAAKVNPVIIEDHSGTDGLWGKIASSIESSDYFVADISSKSPNVVLELGYALREKKPKYNAIFIADNIEVPPDLQGFKLQKYSSIRDFQDSLVKWITDNIPGINRRGLNKLPSESLHFREDFMSNNRFARLWTWPPQCSFQLTSQGLRFSNAHFPLMTTHLSLLRNYEFEFKAKIESDAIRWVVKGTKPFDQYLPMFCIMFVINRQGDLTPHIFNAMNPVEVTHYRVFDTQHVAVDFSEEGWFTITTRVIGDRISVINNNTVLFDEDFSLVPFQEHYNFPYKQGEVGFRCHPGEIGVVNYLEVREIA